MKRLWEPEKKPKILNVAVQSARPQQIEISVFDWRKPFTVYSNQSAIVHGTDFFEISLPLTPAKAFFEIKPAGTASMPFDTGDPSLQVSVTQKDFQPGMNCNYHSNPKLQDFLRFISWFSENAGVLSPGVYRSAKGQFQITYVPVIMEDEFMRGPNGQVVSNPRYGQPSPTSFRVDADNRDGVTKIEASRKFVLRYTVTGRMVLGIHEGSHDFLNVNPDDEREADENAINIARCLGFGKREIGNVLTEVFDRYPSDENLRRTELMKRQLETMN